MCALNEYSCGATATATAGWASIMSCVLDKTFSERSEAFSDWQPAMPSSKREWYIYPGMILHERTQRRKVSLTMPVQMYALWT